MLVSEQHAFVEHEQSSGRDLIGLRSLPPAIDHRDCARVRSRGTLRRFVFEVQRTIALDPWPSDRPHAGLVDERQERRNEPQLPCGLAPGAVPSSDTAHFAAHPCRPVGRGIEARDESEDGFSKSDWPDLARCFERHLPDVRPPVHCADQAGPSEYPSHGPKVWSGEEAVNRPGRRPGSTARPAGARPQGGAVSYPAVAPVPATFAGCLPSCPHNLGLEDWCDSSIKPT